MQKNISSTLSCLSSFLLNFLAAFFLFENTSAFITLNFLCLFVIFVFILILVSHFANFLCFLASGKFNFPWLPCHNLQAPRQIQSIKAGLFSLLSGNGELPVQVLFMWAFQPQQQETTPESFFSISLDPGSQASIVKPSSFLKQNGSASDLRPVVCFKGDFCSS